MINKIKVSLSLLLMLASVAISQTDTSMLFVLPEVKIHQIENQKPVTYLFDNNRNRFIVSDSLLIADTGLYSYKVKILSLSKTSIRDGDYGWRAAGIGAIVGFSLGVALRIGIKYGPEGEGHPNISFRDMPFINIPIIGLIAALLPAIVAGLIGWAVPYYDSYDLTGKELGTRRWQLLNAFRKNQIIWKQQ